MGQWGWVVVVDDRERGQEREGEGKEKLALIPESYLELVRLVGLDGVAATDVKHISQFITIGR